MKVLVACEESQAVTIAFRERGHEAYSCDILPCSGGHPEWHIQKDVRKLFDFIEDFYQPEWDLVIAHPPCTRLANSGVRWLHERNLWEELNEAIHFFRFFQAYAKVTGVKMCIENPIPHKYAINGFTVKGEHHDNKYFGIGKYSQVIQPWQFGHPESKATCLWLYNLPKLIPTNIVERKEQRIWKMSPGPERSKMRSKTFSGIAEAMAQQWGI